MRYNVGISFVNQVSGGYDPHLSKPTNVVNQAVNDMANITETTAATQKAVLGEIRPRVLTIRTREYPGIRFDYILIDGYEGKWKVIHELRSLKGYAVLVGESNESSKR